MARKTTDNLLNTKTARLKLPVQANPHFRTIQEGRAIGYRRIANKSGTWIARRYDPDAAQKLVSVALGSADDASLPADGVHTLTYTQALHKAQEWFAELDRAGGAVVKPITVNEALDAYVADYQARSGRATAEKLTKINAHIIPAFGDKEVAKLTAPMIREWHQGLANAPARLRTKKTAEKQQVREAPKKADKATTEAQARARRSSANRILTELKAALNLAFRNERVASDAAWRRVQPFKGVDTPKVQYLTEEESNALAKACAGDLHAIVWAALLTGCDYSELATANVSAFQKANDTFHITGKRGGRIVHLSGEAVRFFAQQSEGKAADGLLFPRESGTAWGKSQQFRPLRKALAEAEITRSAAEPAISFHILRHTYAVRMLRQGMPMHQVSAQLGHKSVVITAKHYAHVIPSDIAAKVKALPELGIGAAASPAPAVKPGRAGRKSGREKAAD